MTQTDALIFLGVLIAFGLVVFLYRRIRQP